MDFFDTERKMRLKLFVGLLITFCCFLAAIFYSACATTNTTNSPPQEYYSDLPDLTNWHKEPGIRVYNSGSSSTIILNNGQYRMFTFIPNIPGIGSYISADGLTFSQEAGLRVTNGEAGSLDESAVKHPDIVIEDDNYRLYYTGIDDQGINRALSAISTDGFTFTKEAGIRIDYEADYDQHADVPSVVKLNSNEYWAYYVYDWYGDNSIKGALSSDGLSFEVVEVTGFKLMSMDPEVLLDESDNMVMFFSDQRDYTETSTLEIYKATSIDGINWTVLGRAIQADTTFEGRTIGDPDIILLPDGSYRMYYYGQPDPADPGRSDILSATAESL